MCIIAVLANEQHADFLCLRATSLTIGGGTIVILGKGGGHQISPPFFLKISGVKWGGGDHPVHFWWRSQNWILTKCDKKCSRLHHISCAHNWLLKDQVIWNRVVGVIKSEKSICSYVMIGHPYHRGSVLCAPATSRHSLRYCRNKVFLDQSMKDGGHDRSC